MTTLPTFAVHRKEPLLVGPAAPTPHETKRLSDIDALEDIRVHERLVFFYRPAGDRDPASVIRRALGEALVPYYPLAGRVREVEARKLVVDCTGEGVLFVEADADVRLEELEASDHGLIRPPFPCMDQLLFDVEGSSGVVNCPLLLIQVTRLLCGGFAFAIRFNHTICDGIGLAQFLSAVAELARGLPSPTVAPVWSRELLEAPTTFPHPEFNFVPLPSGGDNNNMVTRTFTFSSDDVDAIKKKNGLRINVAPTTTTSFEALAAALWRARTAALELPPDDEVWLVVVVNLRTKSPDQLMLPAGYYGNATTASAVMTTAGALRAGSLGDAVELVRKTKAQVTAELCVTTQLPNLFLVSDIRHVGFHRLDFGWGEPVYYGPTDATLIGGYIIALKNGNGEDVVAVPVALPQPAMDRFSSEIENLFKS